MNNETLWLSLGFLGQGLFSARFLLQWLKSEREKKSVFPIAFWYFSIGGGLTLLSYAIHKQDPVFIVGQAAGLFVYLRNLYFVIHAEKVSAD
ncbi:MAG: lipid A biosynthesis protein [Gammaproteobacteria bacterium HGW-Gammaproteobacteria-3]|nr:MAG: lipid A biosynthesis protein [Gammaproteobacteria bacterium HGW-Gammaproteobacteria-3]